MKKIILLVCVWSLLFVAKAQTPFTNWQHFNFGTGGYGQITSSALDNSGNLIVGGYFYGTIDLDHGPSEKLLSAVGQYDAFIAKYNSFGDIIWAYRLGGTLAESVNDITVDNVGYILLTGFFTGTMNVSVPNGNFPLVSSGGSSDIFLVRLNSDGYHINSYKIGSGGNDNGKAVKVDNAGNIYLTGLYSSPNNNTTVNFNILGGTNSLLAAGSEDGFVVKYNSAFALQWVKSFGGSAFNDAGTTMDVDNNSNVYVAGLFNGTNAGFGNGLLLTSNGGQDAFVMKVNTAGTTVWAKKIGGGTGDNINKIKLDGKGALYTCGYFTGTANLNPNGTAQNFTANSSDAFVSKLDTNQASAIWVKALGGSGLDNAYGIALDTIGNVYTIGSFQGTAQFPIGTAASQIVCPSFTDIFVSKLNSSGNYVWVKQLGYLADDYGLSIASTLNGQNQYAFGTSANGISTHYMVKLGTCAEIGPLTGPIKLCNSSPVVYSVDSVPGAISYTWTLPSGYSGTSTTRSITVTPGTSSGVISVYVNTACGSGLPRTITSNYGTLNLDANLIRYWSANGNTTDLKNSSTLTLVQASHDTDRFANPNSAFRINNGTGLIKLQPEANLPSGATTISFWYYYVKNGGNNNVLIGSNSSTTPAGHPLLLTDNPSGKLYPWSNTGSSIGSGKALVENTWNHIVLARNGASFSLYLNGEFVYDGTNLSLSNFDRLGNNRPGFETQGATGKFDEIKIYNAFLTSAQAKYIFDYGSLANYSIPTNSCINSPLSFQANHSNPNAIYTWKLNGNIVGANSPTYTKTAAIMDSAISVTISSQCFVETVAWKFKVNQKDTIHISSTTCGVKVGNKNYYVSGSYSDTFVNRFGCDSIVYLNLSVNNSQFNNLSANLIRYWTLNKQDSVRDIISNQTLLTHPSLPYTVDRFGMSNAALNIAAGNHVFRPTVALPASNITISFWYYFVSGYTNTRSLLSNNLTNNAGYYLYIDPNGIIKGNNAAGANFSGISTLTTNKWYHFTYTLSSAGVAQIFLNGNLQLTINSVSLSGITRIGNGITNNNNTPGIGSYDDIRVYNTVLSANDIRNLPMRPSIYELPSKKAFCKGDTGVFKIGLNQQVSTQIQSYRNGVLFGSDSTLTINNMATTDSLVSFKIYSQCAYEEYKFPIIVNPTSAIVNDSFCGSYSYNGKTYTNPGTYFDTTLNANGCNFITQLNLSNSGSIEANAGLIRYWTGNIAGGQISLIGNDTITPVGSLQVTGWPGRAGNANGSFFNGLINNTYLKTNLPIMSTYTISFWYKMEVNGYGRQLNLIASNSTTATGSIILAKTGSNSIYVFTSAGATIGNGFSIGANEWNHITLVRNGNNFSFYANGNLISSGNTINTANPDNIGNNGVNNNGNSAIGWYDDIKVYETAVSANQAKAIYKSPSLLSMPDLSNYCIGTNAPFAFQFQKDSISSFQFLRNGVVVSNDTSFNFNPLLSTDTLIGYRIIRSCEIETINIKLKNQGTNLNDGMIRYWTLNVEDNRRDLVTNQSVGFIGTFTQATGRTGKANAALNVASLGNLFYPNTAIPSTNVSVSLWYQRTSASYFGARTIVSNNQANGNIAKYLYVDPSGWLICGTNTANGGVNTNQNITTGLWYHLVYHISSTGTVKVYVNGVLKFTQTGVPVHPITYFGNRPDGNEPGVGNYDDVKIYNRELSAVEVSKLYAMPSLLSHPLNVSACQGSSLLLTYHFANVAGRSFSFSKNGTVLSTDSFLRINSLNLTDTLYNMTLNTNCGIENYSIKITVNPAGGVGPTLTYTKATSRITASSTFNGFKLFRNGVAVDSSSTTGNINYLSTKCGNYFAQYFNNGSAACPSVSPTLTISLDTVIVNASLCSGKAYVFGSQSLTAAGTYYRTVLSSLACDSTIRLNLSLKQTSSSVITRSGCGLISIFGKVYSQTGQYKDTLINAAGCDSLVTLNLTVFSGTPSVSNVSADVCKQFVYRNKTYTQTGIYRDTLFGASATGCDSIIVLNLTIQQINRGINIAGNTLTSLETGATYVWYNCTTNSLIANQTNSSYTPTVSGNYAAIITKNNCTDTSFCTQVLINNCNIGITYTVLNPQDSIACKSVRVSISGATLPIFTNVSWTNNPTGVDIQITDSVHVYNDLCPETYLLRITDATGCKDSINFTINQPSVGLQGYGVSNINIYPNPAQEVVFIDGLRVGSNLILRDLNGKELIATKATEENILMPCSQLAEGVYILLIQEGENTITRKLIITR